MWSHYARMTNEIVLQFTLTYSHLVAVVGFLLLQVMARSRQCIAHP